MVENSVKVFPWNECHQTGKAVKNLCTNWGRQRFVTESVTLNIKIPLSVKDGDVLEAKGWGNSRPGPDHGSLFIKVNVTNYDESFTF